MKPVLSVALAGLLFAVADAQETKVPDDSALISINGCAKNGTFTVGERREDQPGTLEIEPGSRFRLEGPKKLMDDIKSHQRSAMQVTGLIRRGAVNGPQGVGLFGGRVRIGGAPVPQDPIRDPARDPANNRPVLDVRSWKALTGDCR